MAASRIGIGLLLAFALVATLARAQSDPLFGSPVVYPAGPGTADVALGDLNGDVWLDVVTADPGTGTVRVLLGQGGGVLGAPVAFAAGPEPVAIALGDLSGDGALDLVAANKASNTVSVLLGLGDGTFRPPTAYAVGLSPESIAVGALGEDSLLDVVTGNTGTSFSLPNQSISVLLGQGGGLLGAASTFGEGPVPTDVELEDIDADGLLDLFVSLSFGAVDVYAGQPDGTFAFETVYLIGGVPVDLALADVGGDGLTDLVEADNSAGAVDVLPGIGGGAFGSQMIYEALSPHALVSGDLNGDGRADAVVSQAFSANVSVRFGQLANLLAAQKAYPSGSSPGELAVGDMDGDGRLDVVVVAGLGVSVLLNLGPSDPWTDLGFSQPFFGGPTLEGAGRLLPGTAGALTLSGAEPDAPAMLLLAITITPTLFKCGFILAVPASREWLTATSATGAVDLSWSSWPAGLSGLDLYLQWVVPDSDAECGVS